MSDNVKSTSEYDALAADVRDLVEQVRGLRKVIQRQNHAIAEVTDLFKLYVAAAPYLPLRTEEHGEEHGHD